LDRLITLHGYVRQLGERVNQIHSRLERIERSIAEMSTKHNAAIRANRRELGEVKDLIATKQEVYDLLHELNNSITGTMPVLPPRPSVVKAEAEAKVDAKPARPAKKRRFSFLPRF
jgi:Mg2+ and Co2+ transporter CorA